MVIFNKLGTNRLHLSLMEIFSCWPISYDKLDWTTSRWYFIPTFSRHNGFRIQKKAVIDFLRRSYEKICFLNVLTSYPEQIVGIIVYQNDKCDALPTTTYLKIEFFSPEEEHDLITNCFIIPVNRKKKQNIRAQCPEPIKYKLYTHYRMYYMNYI